MICYYLKLKFQRVFIQKGNQRAGAMNIQLLLLPDSQAVKPVGEEYFIDKFFFATKVVYCNSHSIVYEN